MVHDEENIAHPGAIDPHDNVERSVDCVRKSYDWVVLEDGRLSGLVSGDMGWSTTHIVLDADAIHDNLKFPGIDPTLEDLSPYQASALWWFLNILSQAGGATDASDVPYAWINAFCNDEGNHGSDTFNRACDLKLIRTSHCTSYETSTATLTEAGRSWLAENPTAWHAARSAERGLLVDALEPFANWGRESDGAVEWEVDELPLHEKISDWFGKLSFSAARRAYDAIAPRKQR
jgi:hypothetical protein